MTPKEKAEELFNKIKIIKDGLNKYPMCFDTSKQCALISVNEIIENQYYATIEFYKYWQEVKQEIEKL